MFKNILLSGVAILTITGCNTAQLTQVATQAMGQSNSSATGMATSAAVDASTQAAQASVPGNCVGRMNGGSTSFTQMVTEKVVTYAIDSALENVSDNKHVKIPKEITNTCEADKRLAYVKELTKNFNNDLDNANKDILASVEQTKEIQKLQEEMTHKKKTMDEAEYNEGVTEDNTKTLELIKDAKIVDKAKYSAAMGKLALATPINGYMIVGWDKEILEFAKDNMVWGVKNVSALKEVASQLTGIVKVLPTLASLTTSPLYDGRVDEDIAKKASKEAIKKDEEIAKAAEEENGFDD